MNVRRPFDAEQPAYLPEFDSLERSLSRYSRQGQNQGFQALFRQAEGDLRHVLTPDFQRSAEKVSDLVRPIEARFLSNWGQYVQAQDAQASHFNTRIVLPQSPQSALVSPGSSSARWQNALRDTAKAVAPYSEGAAKGVAAGLEAAIEPFIHPIQTAKELATAGAYAAYLSGRVGRTDQLLAALGNEASKERLETVQHKMTSCAQVAGEALSSVCQAPGPKKLELGVGLVVGMVANPGGGLVKAAKGLAIADKASKAAKGLAKAENLVHVIPQGRNHFALFHPARGAVSELQLVPEKNSVWVYLKSLQTSVVQEDQFLSVPKTVEEVLAVVKQLEMAQGVKTIRLQTSSKIGDLILPTEGMHKLKSFQDGTLLKISADFQPRETIRAVYNYPNPFTHVVENITTGKQLNRYFLHNSGSEGVLNILAKGVHAEYVDGVRQYVVKASIFSPGRTPSYIVPNRGVLPFYAGYNPQSKKAIFDVSEEIEHLRSHLIDWATSHSERSFNPTSLKEIILELPNLEVTKFGRIASEHPTGLLLLPDRYPIVENAIQLYKKVE